MTFEYDFSVDGGAIGAIALRQVAGNALEAGVRISDMFLIQDTDVTSAGTPTVVVGNTTDADGYFANVVTLLGSKDCIRVGEVDGALVFDATDNKKVMYSPVTAANLDLNITVGTAALTGGKLRVLVEYFL